MKQTFFSKEGWMVAKILCSLTFKQKFVWPISVCTGGVGRKKDQVNFEFEIFHAIFQDAQ
jgi:hypothetical protein